MDLNGNGGLLSKLSQIFHKIKGAQKQYGERSSVRIAKDRLKVLVGRTGCSANRIFTKRSAVSYTRHFPNILKLHRRNLKSLIQGRMYISNLQEKSSEIS